MGATPDEDIVSILARVETADWTGIQERLDSDPDRVEAIRAKVCEIDALVEKSHLSNSERATAKDHSEALLEVVTQARPRWLDVRSILLTGGKWLAGVVGTTILGELIKLMLF